MTPSPAQILATGDAWEEMPKEGRHALLTLTGQMGIIGTSARWIEIPAAFRLELVHRAYLIKDLLNRVLL